ncbi:MAG: chemotaxis response regulator protein-glutamate methylesterase [Deltaproteobacteria bacterium]|nr:chemotaxis response regulator protein-glutamate methylesterase [Deltaproteobacteria bacterium]
MLGTIKVLVVDDQLLMRKIIVDIFAADKRFEVVGEASNGKQALEQAKKLKPDLITLDVEMPIMDGITCLKQLMRDQPTPVIMVSSITYEGGFRTMQALDSGAFDYIQKPRAQNASSLLDVAAQLKEKAYEAFNSRYIDKLKKQKTSIASTFAVKIAGQLPSPSKKVTQYMSFDSRVIAIGISTGGPPCLSQIFAELPEKSPPVLVVQHMPEGFTKAMADRIDKISRMTVVEAEDGMPLREGVGYIAPGHSHLLVEKKTGMPVVRLSKGALVSGHRPSADALFETVANVFGQRAAGVIMTGMGRDGATQIKAMHERGALTVAQDKESCTVFGMPKAAIEEGAIDEILSLDQITAFLKKIAQKK